MSDGWWSEVCDKFICANCGVLGLPRRSRNPRTLCPACHGVLSYVGQLLPPRGGLPSGVSVRAARAAAEAMAALEVGWARWMTGGDAAEQFARAQLALEQLRAEVTERPAATASTPPAASTA